MPRRRLRLLFLLLLPLYAVGLVTISWIALAAVFADDWNAFLAEGIGALLEGEFWLGALIPAAILICVQVAILLPVLRFRLARVEKGRPLWLSVLLLAAFAAAITLGLVLGLWELGIMLMSNDVEVGDERAFFLVLLSVLVGGWVFWTAVFYFYTRRPRRPENRIGRIIGLLVGGSIVEIALIIPIDVMVRRRTDCYCNTGTFFALGFSILACLWLAGPGALIALTSKRRRAWYDTHCETCGYERGPTPGERCPECGEPWNAT